MDRRSRRNNRYDDESDDRNVYEDEPSISALRNPRGTRGGTKKKKFQPSSREQRREQRQKQRQPKKKKPRKSRPKPKFTSPPSTAGASSYGSEQDFDYVDVDDDDHTERGDDKHQASRTAKLIGLGVLGGFLLLGSYIAVAYFLEIFPFANNACNDAVCAEDIEELRFHLRELIVESTRFPTNAHDLDVEPLIATTARLIFHDCGAPPTVIDPLFGDRTGYNVHAVALCDGCIERGSLNHGFLHEGAIEPLDELYFGLDLHKKMSRADFWVTSALLAMEYASGPEGINDGRHWPNLGFWFGRIDCEISPDADEGPYIEFPGGNFNLSETEEWFHFHMNMTLREAITNIGAHTLGRPRNHSSGFFNHWKFASHVLNNRYYTTIIDPNLERNWTNFLVPGSEGGPFGRRFQWGDLGAGAAGLGTNQNMMLNSDIQLFFNLDGYIDHEGNVSCRISEYAENATHLPDCPLQDPRASSVVAEFGNEDTGNERWLFEFAHVFEKMSLLGHDKEHMFFVESCINDDQCLRRAGVGSHKVGGLIVLAVMSWAAL